MLGLGGQLIYWWYEPDNSGTLDGNACERASLNTLQLNQLQLLNVAAVVDFEIASITWHLLRFIGIVLYLGLCLMARCFVIAVVWPQMTCLYFGVIVAVAMLLQDPEDQTE
jgi:hypothetical protein